MKLKVVLDTNIIVSGLLFVGNESLLLELVEKEEIVMHVSPQMIDELETVLDYPHLKKHVLRAGKSKEHLVARIFRMSVPKQPRERITCQLTDPNDCKIIECAVEAGAEYIVSGDSHLLDLKSYNGIQIVSSKRMLEIIGKK
jgi:uncharacterized protein